MNHWLQEHMKELIAQNSGFLFWMLLFHSSVLAYNYQFGDGRILKSVFGAVFWWILGLAGIFFLTLLLSFMPRRFRAFGKGLLLSVSGVCFSFDVFTLVLYQDVLDEAKIEVVMGTNPRTVLEFCQAFLLRPSLLLELAALIALAFLWRRMQPQIREGLLRISSVLGTMFLSSSLLTVFMLGVFLTIGSRDDAMMFFYRAGSAIRIVMDAATAYHAIGDIAQEEQAMERAREPVTVQGEGIPFVVFVIGEAADRNKMGVYGYALDTTPRLSARLQTDDVFLFDDTIAGATYTTTALRQIFTFAEKGEEADWYHRANLLDIVRDAGYHTAWISNQSPVNVYGNMDRIFSARTDRAQFTAISGGTAGTVARHLDEELLPLLDDELSAAQERNFYVVHLYGSHLEYRLRCPDDFHPFAAADETGESEYRRAVKAEYDNTIAYSDQVLDAILQRFADRDAIVVYLSDHGEEVCDGRDFAGHTDERAGNHHMIEIPMVFWVSSTFAARRPDVVASIAAARHRPYRTDDIIHTFLDLMDIAVPSYRSEKSILSPQFVPAVRLWNGRPYRQGEDNDGLGGVE